MVKLHLELEGDVGEVFRVLRRLGGGDSAGGEVRDGPGPAPAEERASAVDTVPEPGTTATSATLAPGHWTEELAADFTAGLDVVARRVMFQVWRAGERGSHRNVLCQRADLMPVELRSLLIRMGHALRRFQREGAGRCPGRWRPTARCRAISSTPTSPRSRPICSGRGCRTSWPKAWGALDGFPSLAAWGSQTVHRLWNVLTIIDGLWIGLACGVDADDRMVRRYAGCLTDANTALYRLTVSSTIGTVPLRAEAMEERLRDQLERGELTMGEIRADYARYCE